MSSSPPPLSPLARNLFQVHEPVRILKVGRSYKITDPENGELLLHCRENVAGSLKVLRALLIPEFATPFHAILETAGGQPLATISRGWNKTLLYTKTFIKNPQGKTLGYLTSEWKRKAARNKFGVVTPECLDLYGPDGTILMHIKADFFIWEFFFLAGRTTLAHFSKNWSGLLKEAFTSADNYGLRIFDAVGPRDPRRLLIVASAVAIDFLLKPGRTVPVVR